MAPSAVLFNTTALSQPICLVVLPNLVLVVGHTTLPISTGVVVLSCTGVLASTGATTKDVVVVLDCCTGMGASTSCTTLGGMVALIGCTG